MRSLAVTAAAGALLVGACSSSASKSTSPTTVTAAGTPTTVAMLGAPYARPKCTPPVATPPATAHVAGSASDRDLTSFDGTRIRIHWFPLASPAGQTAPTVLKGPGWGQPGDTNTAGSGYGLFGDLSIHALNAAGYNVLTWDPRGFGASSGTVEIDSASYEGRDVQRIIDWVAHEPGVQLDAPNDPRLGMVGGSYGGGIQLVTAAIDCRVDAIVPQIAWHSLQTSLFEAHTVKQGWSDLLYGVTAGRTVDPHITSAHEQGDATGVISAADAQWFADRGPGDLVAKITAPTLFEQGTIDTLFPLDEAARNFSILRKLGVPTAMLWMCSGHGVCLTPKGDTQLPGRAAIAWLDRWVKGDESIDLGARFTYVDQEGVEHTADDFPPPAGTPIDVDGAGALTLVAGGGSGPAKPTGKPDVIGGLALGITPAKASHALNVPFTFPRAADVVGAPMLTLRYSGTSPRGTRPMRVFAQLVDDATGIVLGNQITPVEVVLDGKQHSTTVPLEMVAFTARAGARVTLQLVATTTAYAEPRLGGSVDFAGVRVELPVVTGVARSSG